MRIRRFWVVLGILLLPTAAFADDHRAEIFPGFSYVNASKLFGFHGAGGFTLPNPKSKDLALVADFSIQSGTHGGADITRTTIMGGVRWAFSPEPAAARTSPIAWHVVSVHALVGTVRDGSGAEEGTDGAVAFGAAYDFIPSLAPDGGGWGVRVQADYVIRLGDGTENFPRVSVGALYRFGRKP